MFVKHLLRFGYFTDDRNYFPSEDQGLLDGSENEDDKVDDKEDDKIEEDDKEVVEEDNKEDDVDDDDEEKEDTEEEDTEDKEDEEEEEEDTDKVLTSWTDIKTKYPDFAKEFPDVKNALFREQQFSEVFSTPAEAKDVLDRVAVFDRLSNDVVDQGNIIDLFDTIKKQNGESFNKIAYSLLPYFQENDKDTYYELAARPIKQLLRAAWHDGNGEKTDLGKAAAHIHKYFFKNTNFDEKVKAETGKEASTKSKREEELESKLSQIEQNKQNDFLSTVDESYVVKMTKHIREGIDKDERLTEWTKSKISDDVLREIQRQLKKDTRYVGAVNSLIRQASQNGFTNDFKSRLINTALVRAKSLVPEVRKRIVSEALRAAGKKESRKREETREPRRENRSSNSSRSTNRSSSPKKPMTDLDILRG